MNAVGDRVDIVAGEHEPGDFPMPFCNTIDVVAQVQGQERHVQQIAAAKDVFHLLHVVPAEYLIDQCQRKVIMSRSHRCVRCENAFLPDSLNVLTIGRPPAATSGLLVKQFQREQTRMAFVHVVALDLLVSQGTQYAYPANAEDDFLIQPIVLIAAVEIMGQRSIPLEVCWQITGRENIPAPRIPRTCAVVLPGSDSYRAALDARSLPFSSNTHSIAQRNADATEMRTFSLALPSVEMNTV